MDRHLIDPQRSSQRLHSGNFAALVVAQFLGTFNDNLLKLVISLLAVDAALSFSGVSTGLSLTGVVFIVPYLLFAAYAGAAADAFDKRRVLIVAKAVEVALMGLAAIGLFGPDLIVLLIALFLVASQATFFSPARYGLVPELVSGAELARANGVLEAARQIAVIAGTVSGGVLLELWADRPALIGSVVIVVSILGLLAAFLIRHRRPHPSSRRNAPRHRFGMVRGTARLRSRPGLLAAVLGTTWFDLLTTVVLLDLLLVTRQSMGLPEIWVAAIAGLGGIGVALGALLAGNQSFARRGPRLTPLAGLGLGVTLIALVACTGSFGAMAAGVGILGVFGGLYIVPLYTALQRGSVPDERGRVIATNNFWNMVGALAGSGMLWVLVDGFGLAPILLPPLMGLICIGLMAATMVIARLHRGPLSRSSTDAPRRPGAARASLPRMGPSAIPNDVRCHQI